MLFSRAPTWFIVCFGFVLFFRQDQRNNGIKIQSIQSTQSKSGSSKPKAKEGKSNVAKNSSLKKSRNPVDESKFENYFNFQANVNTIQPHQVLAINRGESLKVCEMNWI